MHETIAALKAEIQAAERRKDAVYGSSTDWETKVQHYVKLVGYINGLQTAVRLLEQDLSDMLEKLEQEQPNERNEAQEVLRSIADPNCEYCNGTGINHIFQHEGNTPYDGFSYPEACDCILEVLKAGE